MPQAVYVHIPFCTRLCYYCDFVTYAGKNNAIDDYLRSLEAELRFWTAEVPPTKLKTIFIGGGTPTMLSPTQMERLLAMLAKYFHLREENIEFTVEANPETISLELLQAMAAGGVNRLSFGVQTFNPKLLKEIGRSHTVDDVLTAVELAKQAGFNNLSFDLMLGLPNQQVSDIKESLQQAIALGPQHFSCYGLKVEEGTPFYRWQKEGRLPLPVENDEVQMYELMRDTLQQYGYQQYEISSFALAGKESVHNLTYWFNEEYYGIGCGAHGYVRGTRYVNAKRLETYLKGEYIDERADVPVREQMENFMILGLRLVQGISRRRFEQVYSCSVDKIFGDVVEKMVEQKLLLSEGDVIRINPQVMLCANEVFAAFLT